MDRIADAFAACRVATRRAAEKERVAHVKSVASIAEPLADFAPFVKAAKAKFGTEIEHYTAASMPEAEHQFCFELLKLRIRQCHALLND